MQQRGDSDYNESRDRTGRVQERIKPIPGKRYGTKKKRNGRLPSSCTWGTRLGISVACHSVASKIESRLGPRRNKARKHDKQQTQEVVLVDVGAVDHEGKQNDKTQLCVWHPENNELLNLRVRGLLYVSPMICGRGLYAGRREPNSKNWRSNALAKFQVLP